MGCFILNSAIFQIRILDLIMSDYQKEIDELKALVLQLSGKVRSINESDDKVDTSSTIKSRSSVETTRIKLLKDLEDSRTELLKELEEQKSIAEALSSENSSLKQMLDKEVGRRKVVQDKIKTHELKMRELFESFKEEQQKGSDNQYKIAELQYKHLELENTISKKEDQIIRLKNQLSYRLGSRIVGLKDKKKLLSLPRDILDDYIDFRTNISSSEKKSHNEIEYDKVLNLPQSSTLVTTMFQDSGLIPLKSQYNSLIIQRGIKGVFELDLFGVRPSAIVEVEVKFEALGNGCILNLVEDNKIVYLEQQKPVYINITLTDSLVYECFSVLSNEGDIRVSFKKLKGVPAYIKMNNSNNSAVSVNNEHRLVRKPKVNDSNLSLPPLKKPNAVLYEAEQLIDAAGKDVALAFAEKNIKKKFKPALNIFNANLVLGQDVTWLGYINNYLSSFDCSPIKLKKSDQLLYYRIEADRPENIEGDTKVSIIMPAFNAEKTIENAINSVLNQTWQNIELIVINDCSEDKTWECIKKLSTNDNRIIAINNPYNVGAYVSKNIGLKLATGDYVTGHDSDDWAHPQRIENHLKAINKEKIKPRASLTRMIRMEENGYFPFYLEGTFCLDGVLRVASITCMFETDFLRNKLGGWDCSRFGADSEIIARAKIVLGDEFKDYHQMSMICLNAPNSLTNNPVHGVQRGKGLSPSRKFYKDQWTEWHRTLNKDGVYLEFPHLDRKFELPKGTEIPVSNIIEVIKNIETNHDL